MTEEKTADLADQKDQTEKSERERTKRLVKVLISAEKARRKDPSISKEDVLAAARAAYKKDPKKSGH